MNAERLLRLYPRAWRDRYGDEFLALAGPGSLSLQQVIDVVSGAIDAWLSTEVRHATRAAAADGGTMTVRAMLCSKTDTRYTKRDGLIGAAVMIAGAIVFAVAGTALKQAGWSQASEAVLGMSFTVPLTLSMPFWMMKGQPRRAQVVIVGVTTTALIAIAWLAAVI
jgi:hypothetical protein